ncbi:MAG: p-hydroxycinnamoyl CoA hydratase/lyase [Deltaproteobacteria bacterium]|nr:p-hydroxycinnamoyl CoA hydratase/lyase [Deltaproteobacteria bacterium]
MNERKYEAILVKQEDGLTTIALNRPEKRNAMSPQLHREMYQVLGELRYDKDTRVIVITGAGESFCAGQDLKQYFLEMDSQPESVRDEVRRMARLWRNEMIRTLPQPVIAMVNGWCFGGGFTIVTACDIAIAAEDAVFGLSEINFGHFPGGEVTIVLTEQLQPKHGLFYALTGKTFTAKEAERIGLITKAVPRENLQEETMEIANNLLEKDPLALKAVKEAWYYTFYSPPDVAYEISTLISQRVTQQHGGRPGIQQFAKKQYRPGLGAYKWEG